MRPKSPRMVKPKKAYIGADGLTAPQREVKLRLEMSNYMAECIKLGRELDRANLRLKQRPTQPCLCRHVMRAAIKSFHPDRNQCVSFSSHEVTQKLLDTLRVVEGHVPLAAVCDVDSL